MADSFAARDAWWAAAELLKEEGKLSDSQMAFVRMAQPLVAVEDIFVIGVGSDFVKDWIIKHVGDVMTDQLSQILGRSVHLKISVDATLAEQPTPAAPTSTNPMWAPTSHETVTPTSPIPHTPVVPHTSAARQDLPADDGPHYPTEPLSLPEHIDIPAYERTYGDEFDENQRINSDVHRISITQLQAQARLNPRYTFDSFVIGESNRFAHATALAVAESPGSTYNPLFLYSDSGMGKTHLLHAIGNYTLTLFPNKKVLYISSEEFTNWFINALRDQQVHTFKDQFRNVDVLLIDDIQFISNKDQTLDEFFHTFNALSNANKQIVITSDVAPKLLTGFEDRMISRFASGITASIDLPNLETRIAILDKKAAAENMAVPREVVEYIATHMTSNVREMEGALRRVTAYADLARQAISLDMAQLVLKDMIADPSSLKITASIIMAQTAAYYEISMDSLTSPTRSRSVTMPRHIAMYLCREMTDLSLPKIAEIFHRRDHTTVINAVRNVENKMAANQSIYNQVTELTTRIKHSAAENARHRD
ncbi:MAG: chromosomal replication initiator protein DnaA [Arcanobacterium sp.]|nr:chromosomal replication initiator protein DnaA [Arcanobacterium sp.]